MPLSIKLFAETSALGAGSIIDQELSYVPIILCADGGANLATSEPARVSRGSSPSLLYYSRA